MNHEFIELSTHRILLSCDVLHGLTRGTIPHHSVLSILDPHFKCPSWPSMKFLKGFNKAIELPKMYFAMILSHLSMSSGQFTGNWRRGRYSQGLGLSIRETGLVSSQCPYKPYQGGCHFGRES